MFIHYLDLSWRSLKRTPLVSFLMILAIAIGIGVTMTSLSVYHMMSMDPIPSKSDKLFMVQLETMDEGEDWWTSDTMPRQLTFKDSENLQFAKQGLRQAAMVKTGFAVHLNNPDFKPLLRPTRATGRDFFEMFNVPFLYGSAWSEQLAQDGAPVVVIGDELNQQLFGGGNNVGKTIYLDDDTYEIVGILAPWKLASKFYDLNNGSFRDTEQVYIPFSLVRIKHLESWGNNNGWKHEDIQTHQNKLDSEILWLQFWVELPDASSVAMYKTFLKNYIAEQQKVGRFNRNEPRSIIRNVKQWLEYNEVVSEDNKILVGLSFMFLAVCLANILGLLLAKFMRRAPEIGVRRALGASKTQVFAQHMVEVSVLGLLGGVLGIVIAQIGLIGIRQADRDYEMLAVMDPTMLLSAPMIAISACILAGLYPAWLVCKTNPAIYLKSQ
ncbi:ABC transporter permease [Pseudoalteromonas tunicata]|jgi:putative ABC transport system permease protein|uniref:ABC transporter permease n=1 Tax=Pseudoalteromonas tunicata D2 TaxID=87626 RepID=A4C439_9GAMM|nr:ABC transporter permease [Pseudoalteromonas tunicata]ATC97197.1 putative ABC transport system permease protein [Pseudoalteromonas tunicata]AXT33294.1 ABC transporter permease [Pseudoalteromonas tunicata]EAR30321.1 ABC transporter permease [Pseudoalteromonas tunicata D2]MDP4984913.1 ABC transporter permease [Pseudoalteromonas tunicata]